MMPNAADIPPGRRGRYRCPFCGSTDTSEDRMNEHRQNDPECRRRNDAVRSGIHPVDLDMILGRQLSLDDALINVATGTRKGRG